MDALVAALLKLRAFREALLRAGWTPPVSSNLAGGPPAPRPGP